MRRTSKLLLAATPLLLLSSLSLGNEAPARFVEHQGGSIAFSYPGGRIRAGFHIRIENSGGRPGTPRCWAYLPDGSRQALELTSEAPIPPGATEWIDGEVWVPARFRPAHILEDIEADCADVP